MDRVKGIAKGGWHPSGDKPIHRESWKSDIKGIATGKKKDPYAYAHEHQSTPLHTLRDPSSFGPPPKHRGYNSDAADTADARTSGSSAVARPLSGGWGSAVPNSHRHEQEQEQQEEEQHKPPPVPYRVDTTGLRTDNLPKPPVHRARQETEEELAPPQPPRPGNTIIARQVPRPPPTPPRHGPSPVLPPRMNDHPDEHTPAPPPPYQASPISAANVAAISAGAASRLGRAGVSVPGFGIGGNNNVASTPKPAAPIAVNPTQVSELQQRFARMNPATVAQATNHVAALSSSGIAAAAQKKAPPPPPPKRANLSVDLSQAAQSAAGPPALPLASKPRQS